MLADRFGGRAIVAQAMCGWSAFTALTAAAYNLPSLIGIRFTFGALEAGLVPAIAVIVHEAVPEAARSTAFGLFLSAGRLGGAFAPVLTAAIVVREGWRTPFLIFAGIGLAATIAWLFVVRPVVRPLGPKMNSVPWRLLATRSVVALLLVAFAYTFMWQFYATWYPTYLVERFGYSLSEAARYASLPFLFGIAGNGIGGHLVDRLSRHLGAGLGRTISGSAVLVLSAVALVFGAHDSSPGRSIWELSAAAGLGDIFLSAAWTSAVELGGKSGGALSGAMNTASNLGAMLSPVVLGWARQHSGNWSLPLALATSAATLSAVIWPFVNSFCKTGNSTLSAA